MPCEGDKCTGSCGDKGHEINQLRNEQIIKSYERKMKFFEAMDKAFCEAGDALHDSGEEPSFQEMFDAISMLETKVRRGEIMALSEGAYVSTPTKDGVGVG